jgi:flagellar motility protein MotE (MotC chaperone)
MKGFRHVQQIGLLHVFAVACLAVLALSVAPELSRKVEPVLAAVGPASAQDGETRRAGEGAGGASGPARLTAGTCWNESEFAVLADLRERARADRPQGVELAERRSALKAARKRLEQKMQRMRALKQDLKTRLAARNKAAREDIERLVRIYSNMRPEKAAKVMNRLTLATAADIMQRVQPRDAAEILTQMDADAGSRLTRELDRRRRMLKGEAPVKRGDRQGGA